MAALTPAAAEGLVAALQRAQAELEWVANRLEEEFAAASRKGDINTLSLLTRLNRLRRCPPAGREGGRPACSRGTALCRLQCHAAIARLTAC